MRLSYKREVQLAIKPELVQYFLRKKMPIYSFDVFELFILPFHFYRFEFFLGLGVLVIYFFL